MHAATDIFLNGIFGVFTGLAVLYITIKITHLLLGRKQGEKEE